MDALLAAIKKFIKHSPEERALYSIEQFCAAENISRSTYNKLTKLGFGPECTRLPNISLKRISHAARLQWRARMDKIAADEAKIPSYAARQAELHRKKQAAGKKAAQSPRHHSRKKKGRAGGGAR